MTQKIIFGGNVIPWIEKSELCAYYIKRSPISVKIFLDGKKTARGYYYLDDRLSFDNEGHYSYV